VICHDWPSVAMDCHETTVNTTFHLGLSSARRGTCLVTPSSGFASDL
jgi:hypothetical protein